MTGPERVALQEALLDVVGLVLSARLTVEVGPGPLAPARAAALLLDAAEAVARVRSMPGLPVVESAGVVAVLVDALPTLAGQQLAQLLDGAVRGASYDVDPQVVALCRDLRAWSLRAAQEDAPQVFRNTPDGLAPEHRGRARSARDIDIDEAARRTGLSTGLLRRHGRKGRLGGRLVAGAWRFDARAVDVLAASRVGGAL